MITNGGFVVVVRENVFSQRVRRAEWIRLEAPAIVLGRSTALPINEGSRNTYTVGLNVAPAGNVVVRVLWSDDGAVKVNKTGGTAASYQDLTFTPSGAGIWSTNQTVMLVKEHDDDTVDESVTITASVMDADTQDTNDDDASAKTFTVRLGASLLRMW